MIRFLGIKNVLVFILFVKNLYYIYHKLHFFYMNKCKNINLNYSW